MTRPTPEALRRLVAEAREWMRSTPSMMGSHPIVRRLADALEPLLDAQTVQEPKMLVDADWLRRKVETDPDIDTEAGKPLLDASERVGERASSAETEGFCRQVIRRELMVDGEFHGPHVEHFSCEQQAFYAAIDRAAKVIAAIPPQPPGAPEGGRLFMREDEDPAEYDAAVARAKAEHDALLAAEVPALKATIAALTDRRGEMEAALKPFAFIANLDECMEDGESAMVNITLCRRARAALQSDRTNHE